MTDGYPIHIKKEEIEAFQHLVIWLKNNYPFTASPIESLSKKIYQVQYGEANIIVKVAREEATEYVILMDWLKTMPYYPDSLWHLKSKMKDALKGCFIHGIPKVKFRKSSNEFAIICPDCNPKEYTEYQIKYPRA